MKFIDYKHLMYNAILIQENNITKESKAILSRFKQYKTFDNIQIEFGREGWNNIVLCGHINKRIDVTIENIDCEITGIMADKNHAHVLYFQVARNDWKKSRYAMIEIGAEERRDKVGYR